MCYARKESFTPNKNQKLFLRRFFTSFLNQNQSVLIWRDEDRSTILYSVSDNSIKIPQPLGCSDPPWVKYPAGQLSFQWQRAADKRDRNSSSVLLNRLMILNESCHLPTADHKFAQCASRHWPTPECQTYSCHSGISRGTTVPSLPPKTREHKNLGLSAFVGEFSPEFPSLLQLSHQTKLE